MGETELRWGLRQLPREMDPPHDLWPGIAARLQAPRRRRWPWLAGIALAASLVLAVGLALPGASPPAAPGVAELEREADALTREYQAALDQFAGAPLPAPLQPDLATLDQSALDIRTALEHDPEAVYLLEQLRRTYARRLALTQRAVLG
jgi:hypothetical protein